MIYGNNKMGFENIPSDFLVMFSLLNSALVQKYQSTFSYYKSTPRGSMSSYTHGYSDSKCGAK